MLSEVLPHSLPILPAFRVREGGEVANLSPSNLLLENKFWRIAVTLQSHQSRMQLKINFTEQHMLLPLRRKMEG